MYTLTQNEHYNNTNLSLQTIGIISDSYAIPATDILLIAINLLGVRMVGAKRIRIYLQLNTENIERLVIVSANPPQDPPFFIKQGVLFMQNEVIGTVRVSEVDDAIGGYFRAEHSAITLNPAARSKCTGCVFCPNTLESANDEYYNTGSQIEILLNSLAKQSKHQKLSDIIDLTVSSGCFIHEERAIEYLTMVREVMNRKGMSNTQLGVLSSVIRTNEGIKKLSELQPVMLWITLKCFERRTLLLKESKASLAISELPRILGTAKRYGVETSFTYIVGLDPLDKMIYGIESIVGELSYFPNLQIYQAHNLSMASYRQTDADSLLFFLKARQLLEQILAPTELVPTLWRNYRPLWYTNYLNTFPSGPAI